RFHEMLPGRPVVAVRVVVRHEALVGPEEVNLRPGDSMVPCQTSEEAYRGSTARDDEPATATFRDGLLDGGRDEPGRDPRRNVIDDHFMLSHEGPPIAPCSPVRSRGLSPFPRSVYGSTLNRNTSEGER